MPSSIHRKSAPSNSSGRPEMNKKSLPREIDDEAVDFSNQALFDESPGALSFHVARSGPMSGSSILPWSELVQHSDAGGGQADHRDTDILRDILHHGAPPSKIIAERRDALRTPRDSHSIDDEESALAGLDEATTAFPTDISSPRLKQKATDPTPADERPAPPPTRHHSNVIDASTILRHLSTSEDVETSAVDLATRAEIDLTTSPTADRSAPASPTDDDPDAESGTLDLVRASRAEFDLERHLRTSASPATALQLRPVASHANRATAWIAGTLVGLVAGAAAVLGMWYEGYLPYFSNRSLGASLPSTARLSVTDPAVTVLRTEAEAATKQTKQAQGNLDSLLAKLRSARLDPTDLTGISERLAQADEGRKAKAAHDVLVSKLREAKIDPSDLAKSLAQLAPAESKTSTAALASVKVALKEAEAQIAELRSAAATAAQRQANEEARLDSARQAFALFQVEINKRLLHARVIEAGAAPGELLAGLDRALQQQAPQATAAVGQSAERHYVAGLDHFRGGQFSAAARAFALAVQANDRDARFLYYRGLARWMLDEFSDADRDFAQAAELERQNLPNGRDVDFALERIQGPPRQALNRFRP